MFSSLVIKLSGLFANLEWLAVTSQYLFNGALVFTFFVAGLNQDLNFSCFSHFKANLKDNLFLLESKVSRLSVFRALLYEVYELPSII